MRRPSLRPSGGGWKLAYADFTTAMMAFFLLMWIINGTEQDTRADLADYFGGDASADASSTEAGIEELIFALDAIVELEGRYRVTTGNSEVRVELFDTPEQPMFALGKGGLTDDARRVLEAVAPLITSIDNTFEIEGHTDALPIARGAGTNWGLSAARAEAAREVLILAGVPSRQITAITGRGASMPIVPDDPEAAANRRISLIFEL